MEEPMIQQANVVRTLWADQSRGASPSISDKCERTVLSYCSPVCASSDGVVQETSDPSGNSVDNSRLGKIPLYCRILHLEAMQHRVVNTI